MNRGTTIGLLCFLGLLAASHAHSADAKTTAPYACHRTGGQISVDGKLDEPGWQKAAVLDFYVPETLAEPISRTEGRLLWDSERIYIGFKAYDRDVWSYYTDRDARTCQEDVLEFFCKPSALKETYYGFETNALGTIMDFRCIKEGAGGEAWQRWIMWNCSGIKVGVTVEGTLNNLNDEDSYWQMELAIPLKELVSPEGEAPTIGLQMLFCLGRYDYSVYLPKGVELSASARLSAVNFHQYKEWRTLEFAE